MAITENYQKDSEYHRMRQEINCRENPCTDYDWFYVELEARRLEHGPAIWVSLSSFGPADEEVIIWEQTFRNPEHAEAWADKVATALGGRILTYPDSNFLRRHHGKV